MSVTEVLDSLLLQPLVVICDLLFSKILREVRDPGLSLISLAVAVNVLIIPLHYQLGRWGRRYRDKPFAWLSRASDLVLPVVVLVAVYRYLADLPALKGVGFLGIADLSQPDGLLWGVNLLPLLMTAAGVASVLAPSGDRRKTYLGLGLTVVLLLLLYGSPSGLVAFWTGSNVVSWIRNGVGTRLVRKIPVTWKMRLSRLVEQR